VSIIERLGLAIVRPRSALALAGDRDHAGRSGSDLLVAILVLIAATQLRAIVAAIWLGVAVGGALGVRALVQTLSDTLVIDLGFLVVSAAIIYAATGGKRELGRAFDFACVAVLPLLFVDLIASVVVFAADLAVPRTMMWALSFTSYAWTAGLTVLACIEARTPCGPASPKLPQGGPSAQGGLALAHSPRSVGLGPARTAGWVVAAIAVAGMAVQIVWLTRHLDRVKPMTAGDPAPQFALPVITGKDSLGTTVSLTPGKVHVIDFWATWCGPCLKAMPKLDALARAHPELVVLAINIDDYAAAFELFAARNYVMPLLAGDRETQARYGVAAIPHTVVIDRAGLVRRVFRGSTMNLEREVSALLK
jgi:thiol-disulfide isomerase/thioredoxin